MGLSAGHTNLSASTVTAAVEAEKKPKNFILNLNFIL